VEGEGEGRKGREVAETTVSHTASRKIRGRRCICGISAYLKSMFFYFLAVKIFFICRTFNLIFLGMGGHHVETRQWGKCELSRQRFVSCPYLFLIGLISNVLNSYIPGLGVCNGYQKANKKKK
jgi:hypothetical protein